MSIGKWIVVTFVLFAIFIGTLVTICVRQDISLVSKDYYRDELQYQEQIKRISNTNELTETPLLKMDKDEVVITFDERVNIQRGRIKIFYPSNEKLDREFLINSEDNNHSFIIQSLPRGLYRVKVWWTMDNRDYYLEKEFIGS